MGDITESNFVNKDKLLEMLRCVLGILSDVPGAESNCSYQKTGFRTLAEVIYCLEEISDDICCQCLNDYKDIAFTYRRAICAFIKALTWISGQDYDSISLYIRKLDEAYRASRVLAVNQIEC